ncbi:MAG: nitronate monooxygenase [Myxococcota bacterium]|nr:nitronate monooxygenase [Myxococcota bacterium]
MPARLRTPVCDLLGMDLPVVQTGMGWVSGARLTAATSEAGGLGMLAAATMTLDQLEAQIHEVKTRTRQPFGVNLRGDASDLEARLELLIREEIPVASFAGVPSRTGMQRLKDAGVLTMPKVGAPRHAQKMMDWGADIIIAQGGEGGGHTGSIPTTCLLPQVVDAVQGRVPVLGAGGFSDGRGLVAALAYGAQGIAMGTRFLLTQESTVPDAVKQAYLQTPATGTVVTTAVDGHPQRVVRTGFIDRLERAGFVGRMFAAIGHALAFRSMTGTSLWALFREGRTMRQAQSLTWPQVAMAANAPMYTRATMVEGQIDAGILPTGQVVGRIDALPTVAELLHGIVAEAEASLDRLGTPPTATDGGEP